VIHTEMCKFARKVAERTRKCGVIGKTWVMGGWLAHGRLALR
jgi:hypothetical protein